MAVAQRLKTCNDGVFLFFMCCYWLLLRSKSSTVLSLGPETSHWDQSAQFNQSDTQFGPLAEPVCQISVGFLVSLFWTCFWESKRELGVKFKQIFSFCFSFYQQTCNTTCNWLRTINVSLPNTGQLWFLCFRLPSTSEKCWHWKKKLKCVQRYMSGYTGPESVKLLEKSNVITVKCHSPSLQWTY